MDMKIVKSTAKGQITLPKGWRDRFGTDNFILEIAQEQILVRPISIEKLRSEDVIFDADRDNNGNGVPISEMLRLLKKIRNESN